MMSVIIDVTVFFVFDTNVETAFHAAEDGQSFRDALGVEAELTGVDIRPDIVATCRATAERLDLAPPDVEFIASDIAKNMGKAVKRVRG